MSHICGVEWTFRRAVGATVTLVAIFSAIRYALFERRSDVFHPGLKKLHKDRIFLSKSIQPTSAIVTSVTSAKHSTYHIINRKNIYNVNDRIQVLIVSRDAEGNPRTARGDYFRAKIVSADVRAASRSDGEVIDLGNGTYRSEFVLRWPGSVNVSVMLVLGERAVAVLERMRRENPSRGSYIGVFKKGTISENTTCNVEHVTTLEKECDFSDRDAHVPWFCVKPTHPKLGCRHWWKHYSNNSFIYDVQTKFLRGGEEHFFSTYKEYLPCNDCTLKVRHDESHQDHKEQKHLPLCFAKGVQPKSNVTSGYYYNGSWISTQCRNRRFDAPSVMQCLKNRKMLVLGDSTAKQVYSFLNSIIHGRKIPPIKCMLHTHQDLVNIDLYQKFHGLPSRGSNGGPSSCLSQNIITVLDHLEFHPDILLLSVGAHFSIHTVQLFAERMRMIRAAVERLHQRSPNTLFFLKSANTREYETLSHVLSNNEWYLYTLDRLVRKTFSDYPNLIFIDEWDMTVAQFYPDKVHPNRDVIANIVDLILSYACPA